MRDFSYQQFFKSIPSELTPLFQNSEFVWDALKQLESYLANTGLGKVESSTDGCFLLNADQVSIGKNVVIEPGTLIEGPCIIGDRSEIRHGAAVRGGTVIGSECVVGHASEVKRSILLDRAKAPHFNYVGDAIMGCDVNLGSGVKFANLRLDRKTVRVRCDDEVVDTGLKKFSGVLGDGTQIGCNCVLNPGCILFPGTLCRPCTSVSGVIC